MTLQLDITRPTKDKYAKKEVHASHFLPYKCYWNKNTILTKKNELMQVVKIGGFSFETADDEDLDNRKNMRNLLLKNVASGNLTLHFYTFRRKRQLELHETQQRDSQLTTEQDFTTYLAGEWRKKYINFKSFENELYIAILYKPDKAGAAILEYLYKALAHKSDKNAWVSDMRDMFSGLEEMSGRILNTFRDYDARLLGISQTDKGIHCEILEFLGTIVNCGYSCPLLVPSEGAISPYLPTSRLFFGSKAIEARGTYGSKYAGIISILEYGPLTTSGIFDGFLQMPFEFIVTQSFNPSNRVVAINKMQLQQNRMIQAGDKAFSQIAEISKALDLAMSGDISFGEHHFSILCIADSLKELELILSMAAVELSNSGIKPVRETINLEPSYWGQLPGNINYITRKSIINSLNLAGYASMHNYPSGKITGNHWGEYVTILDTTSGTPYYFSFHVRDVGHTLIIGPTGGGKTVLMNFLCAQTQKFKPRTFFFDKDRGAEIFIRALGGVYTIIDPSAGCGFNPLQLPDTGENRTFLLEWLKLLVTVNGEKITASDLKSLSLALDGNYRLNPQDRKLSNIVPFLGIDGPDTLAGRIAIWHSKGSHSRVFDNNEDQIDLRTEHVFGFEMAELLKDPISLAPVLLYVFHRINISLDGSATMIVLDEAWALIDNPVFGPKLRDWLKVLRKQNAFVIFATQSVEDATKSQLSDTLIQQTATQIFLPNLKATNAYRTSFMLSQREYNIIRTTDPGSRYFLIKQGLSSVVAKVNLAGMDNIINVLSGRADSVGLVEELIKQYGADPKIWLPIFYKKVKEL